MRTVYFLSDFGVRDVYAGVVRAVLRRRAPGAAVVDLAHDLPPGDLRHAAFQLYAAVPYLEPGGVVLAVVDPGVGRWRYAVNACGTCFPTTACFPWRRGSTLRGGSGGSSPNAGPRAR